MKIYIARKAKVTMPKKATVKAIREGLAFKCRERRPGIEALFLDGGFARLPMVEQHEVDSLAGRLRIVAEGRCFEVALEDTGRIGAFTDSAKESIRIWIGKQLAEVAPKGSYAVFVIEEA